MRFQEEALRPSCGCALQIFPALKLNNILVISNRAVMQMSASPTYSA
jgi:hypothetical protein